MFNEKEIRELIKSLQELIAVLENTLVLGESHDDLVESVRKMLANRGIEN